jgi:hypothetical protein
MPDVATLWPWIEKAGVGAVLAVNSFVLYKAGVVGLAQVMEGKWVPGRYYDAIKSDNVRLVAENDALRDVAFRAVGVAERIGGTEGHDDRTNRSRPGKG